MSGLPGQADNSVHPSGDVVVEQPKPKEESIAASNFVGISELQKTDRVLVQQLKEHSEANCNCCDYEGENEFEITDRFGHQIFYATEDSGCCSRQCCNSLRAFELTLSDRQGKDCVRINRPFQCDNCWLCPCMNQTMEVEFPVGTVVARVEQKMTLFAPAYQVVDMDDNVIYTIQGPMNCCNCVKCFGCCVSRNIVFKIVSEATGEQVGSISKDWNGVLKDVVAKADRFSVDFPPDIECGMKASLLAATFLIDYLHFEADPGDEDQDANDFTH